MKAIYLLSKSAYMRIINHLAALFAKSQKQEGRYRLEKKMDYIIAKNLPCLCCVCTWEFSVSQYNNSLLAWPIYFQRENSSFYTVHLPRYAMHNALKSLFMNCALTKFLPNVQNVTFWRVTRYGFAKNCAKTTNNSRLGDFCEKTHLVHNSKIHNLHLIAGLFLVKPIW